MLNGLFRKTPDSIPVAKKTEQNIGTKLYDKGLRYMEILETKLEKFRKLRQENEDRNLTFSPKVNKSKYRSNAEILLKSGIATEEKLEKMRGEKLNSEINECTFSPQINRTSQILSLKRKSPIGERETQTPFSYDNEGLMNIIKLKKLNIHEELFEEAKILSEKRKEVAKKMYDLNSLKDTYSFHPDTSLTKAADDKILEQRGKYKRISDSRHEILKYLRLKSQNYDLEANQELFKPKIHYYPIKERRFKSPCRRCNSVSRSSSRLTSDKSEKIVNRIKFLRFSTIFKTLCPINGTIDRNTICKASLNKDMRKILEPLLNIIEMHELSIDFQQFSIEMEELMKNMTPEEKNFIIKGEKPEPIVRSRSYNNSPVREFKIYERNVEKLKNTRNKIEKWRKLKNLKEVEKCTFSPVTKNYVPVKEYKDIWALCLGSKLNKSACY
ncbi:hypothetical protein SteCoe_23090 [Stentor coeruleus]|uniref:Uncharacterized protein n=1 Tax=Stentor coeruleus TaxID=5963 RepID=A0A1R2BKP6_9CILI|nr:hypothetical protein SteCoe_23090 [Stentor coeruleus]